MQWFNLRSSLVRYQFNRQWLLLGLIGIFMLSFAYNIWLGPTLERRDRLETRFREVANKLQALSQYRQNQQKFDEEAQHLEQQIEFLETVLPEQWRLEKITAHLLEVLETSHLMLKRQLVLPEENFVHHAELTFHLEMAGSYVQLLRFIQQLEALPFLINIRRLEIHNRAPQDPNPQLNIQLRLSIYRRQSVAKEEL